MSRSTSNNRLVVLAIAILAASILGSAAPMPPLANNADAFTITQDLVRAFYPEVFSNGWHAHFSVGSPADDAWTQFRGVGLKITKFGPGTSANPVYDAKTGKMAPPPGNPTFLEGSTWIDDHARILEVHFGGDLAHSTQRDALRQLVESHPEWSEGQQVQALQNAGASFGPAEKEAFVNSLHLARAEHPLGRLKVLSVDFVLPDAHIGNFAAGAFQWVVRAEAQLPDGDKCKYALGFEPFKGKLIYITRM